MTKIILDKKTAKYFKVLFFFLGVSFLVFYFVGDMTLLIRLGNKLAQDDNCGFCTLKFINFYKEFIFFLGILLSLIPFFLSLMNWLAGIFYFFNLKQVQLSFLVIIALSGMVFNYWLTNTSGLGLSPDSFHYFDTAKNFLEGKGLIESKSFAKEIHHPPFFAFVVSLISLSGLSIIEAARFLQSILFGCNIFLLGYLLIKYTHKNLAVLLGLFIFITSTNILQAHSFFWSEPLFLFFSLVGFVFFLDYLDTRRRAALILSASIFALALLTRYLGISWIVWGLCLILLIKNHSKEKIRNFFLFGTLASLPFVLLVLRNFVIFGNPGNLVGAHILILGIFQEYFKIVNRWFISFYLIVAFVLLICFLAYLFKSKASIKLVFDTTTKQLGLSLVLFILVYSIILLLAFNFSDAGKVLDQRFLIPIFLFMLIFICIMVTHLKIKFSKSAMQILFLILVALLILIFLLFYFTQMFSYIYYFDVNGALYSSAQWKNSNIVSEINKLNTNFIYITSPYEAINFLVNKPIIIFPRKKLWQTGEPINKNYLRDMYQISNKLRFIKGYFVIFKENPNDPNDEENGDIPLLLNGTLIKKGSDFGIGDWVLYKVD